MSRIATIEGILKNVGVHLSYSEAEIVHEDNEISLICSVNFSSGVNSFQFIDEDGLEQELTEEEMDLVYAFLYDALEDHRREYNNSEWNDIQEDNFDMIINQY